MARAQIQIEVTLTEMNCGECGGVYAISEPYREQRYKKGEAWHCPYCQCGWGYTGNSENEKLKKELAAERDRKLQALSEANSLRESLSQAEKRAAKARKRAAAGVCPCCQRTVSQMARHIATKHPEYAGVKPPVVSQAAPPKPPQQTPPIPKTPAFKSVKKPKSDYVARRLAEIESPRHKL